MKNSDIYCDQKSWTNIKNIINNLHRNYLIFIQFITNNLNDEQFEQAQDWAAKLEDVLYTRPVMKSHYNVHNSELLQNNNNISLRLLKDLLRRNPCSNEFKNEATFIMKNMEHIEVLTVIDLVTTAISVSRNNHDKSMYALKNTIKSQVKPSQ